MARLRRAKGLTEDFSSARFATKNTKSTKRKEGIEMNMRMIFVRAVAGRFLDRINMINRIVGNVRCLNLVNPVNPV